MNAAIAAAAFAPRAMTGVIAYPSSPRLDPDAVVAVARSFGSSAPRRVIDRAGVTTTASSIDAMGDTDRRRYARFYYERFRREYPDIYRNSAMLGDFLKLIVESELAWPNHPEIPGSVRKSSVATLLEAGLIRIVGYGYELRGFQAERQRRSEHAQKGARGRYGDAPSMLRADNGHESGTPKTKKKDEEELLEGEQGVRPLASAGAGVNP